MNKFNFLVPVRSQSHLSYLKSINVDEHHYEFTQGKIIWTLQTYLILRNRMDGVTCTRFPKSDAINIAHCQYLRKIQCEPHTFICSISGEYRHLFWAHMHIVQNQKQHDGKRYFWIPHWMQPGLIPRKENRTVVDTVAYAGDPRRLSVRNNYLQSKIARFGYFTSKTDGNDFWSAKINNMGMHFAFLQKPEWNDYSEIDILVGIRSFDGERYNYLPPTKLINAWHAGIPFIGGNDSAFEQVGTPGKDYIKVKSKEEAIQEIIRLRRDHEYYKSFVEAGMKQAKEYTREKIAGAWIQLLTGDMQRIYNSWTQKNIKVKKLNISFFSGIENMIRRSGRWIT